MSEHDMQIKIIGQSITWRDADGTIHVIGTMVPSSEPPTDLRAGLQLIDPEGEEEPMEGTNSFARLKAMVERVQLWIASRLWFKLLLGAALLVPLGAVQVQIGWEAGIATRLSLTALALAYLGYVALTVFLHCRSLRQQWHADADCRAVLVVCVPADVACAPDLSSEHEIEPEDREGE